MLPKRQKCCVSRPTKRDISCQRTFFDMRTIEMERWWKQQFSMIQPSRRYHKTLCVYLLLALLCLPSFGLWVSVSAMQKKMWVRAKDRRSVLVNVFTTPSHIRSHDRRNFVFLPTYVRRTRIKDVDSWLFCYPTTHLVVIRVRYWEKFPNANTKKQKFTRRSAPE